MSDEYAKATKEVAKTTGMAIGASEKLGSFLSKYLDEPFDLLSGIVRDKFAYMRWERQIRLMEKAEFFLNQRKLSDQVMKPVPPKLAIPLIQAASLENNNELQDLWAQMLVNASDPNWPVSVEIKHVSILNELSLYDVTLLDKICSESRGFGEVFATLNLPNEVLPGDINIDEGASPKPEVQLSIENMIRLGLCRNETLSHKMLRIRIMMLGWDFYKACANKI